MSSVPWNVLLEIFMVDCTVLSAAVCSCVSVGYKHNPICCKRIDDLEVVPSSLGTCEIRSVLLVKARWKCRQSVISL